MPSNRFYIDAPLRTGSIVTLTGAEHHHLKHVMRCAIGDEAELINGKGELAISLIKTCTRHEAELTILTLKKSPPPPFTLHLVLGISQMSKMEIAIEKGTELGATHFTAVMMERSKKPLSASNKQKLELIITGALKQCGALYRPSLDYVEGLSSLKVPKGHRCLFGDVRASSRKEQKKPGDVTFIIGPQAGFSDEEHNYLEKTLSAHSVHLSSHILRFETAAIAAAALYGY